jgi:hypothetical protein
VIVMVANGGGRTKGGKGGIDSWLTMEAGGRDYRSADFIN